MPQATKRMAALGSVVALSTVDVYELASAIGTQFEKLIDCHGPESVTGLMPMVIRVLEHLEELAKLNEAEQTELVDLRFTVERLQTEKKLKAEERMKFEKELEQIEEMWKNDACNQRDVITRLEDENHRMAQALREKLFDARLRDEEEDRILALQGQIHSLQDIIQKQRDEMRSVEKDLACKNTEIEMLQSQIEQLTRLNTEHRRRASLTRRQAQQLVEDKADLQALLHDKDQEVTRIRCQLKRYSGDSDQMLSSSAPVAGAGAEGVCEQNKFSASVVKAACPEPDELQLKLEKATDDMERYKPESTKLESGSEQLNMEEIDPPVQGPINQEPDEKLHPERHYRFKESGIRKFFSFLLSPSKPSNKSPVSPSSSSQQGSVVRRDQRKVLQMAPLHQNRFV